MSNEAECYNDVDLIDDMDKHLQEALTLADLLANYSPSHGGVTSYGDPVANTGHMLLDLLCDARDTFKKLQAGLSEEAGRAQS